MRKPHLGSDTSTANFHFHLKKKDEQAPLFSRSATLGASVLMGVVFGFALQKGMVHLPGVIRSQFLFSQNRMLSMFLSAAATSAVVIQTLKLVVGRGPAFDEYSTRATRGPVALLVGGALLGMGMQFSGSCPGTVWVQAGALVPNFLAVWVGGLLAAAVFAQLFETLEQSGLFEHGKAWLDKHAELPSIVGLTGYLVAAALFAVVFVANLLDPAVAPASDAGKSFLLKSSWHPAFAGVLVGLLELPATFIWGELIGSAQSYVTLVAQVLPANSYLQRYRDGVGNLLQIFFMGGAISGAFVSALLGHNLSLAEVRAAALSVSTPYYESFLGGFLLVFGARLAAGCTSGHGISGMGSLATGSFIAVCGMFGGAIATGVLRTFVF